MLPSTNANTVQIQKEPSTQAEPVTFQASEFLLLSCLEDLPSTALEKVFKVWSDDESIGLNQAQVKYILSHFHKTIPSSHRLDKDDQVTPCHPAGKLNELYGEKAYLTWDSFQTKCKAVGLNDWLTCQYYTTEVSECN